MKKAFLTLLIAVCVASCGGGGGGSPAPVPTRVPTPVPTPAPVRQKVGDIFSDPAQLGGSEIKSDVGYSGIAAVSRAIAASGRSNILDMLFTTYGAGPEDKLQGKVASNLDQIIQDYVKQNSALLVPGIRVVVEDEVFWNPPSNSDDPVVLQRQLDALATVVAAVRKIIPQAQIGITITPYAIFDRPNTLAFAKRAMALVDWVGTDPYWYGDSSRITALHAWSKSFVATAKAANPRIETWYIAQAFRLPSYDLATYRSYITEDLTYAAGYDGVLFYGWNVAFESADVIIGAQFDADTKRLYQTYLK